jgi:hypothetical protein
MNKDGYEYLYSVYNDDDSIILGNQTHITRTPYLSDADFEQSILQNFIAPTLSMQNTSFDGSDLDLKLIQLKTVIKEKLIIYIKSTENITQEGMVNYITDSLGELAGSLTSSFVELYVEEAFNRNLIENQTLEDLIVFIKNTPIELLQEIK